MTMRIKRRSHKEWLVLFVLFMPFTFFILIDLLGLPSLVKYTVDVAWLLLLVIMLIGRVSMPNSQSKKILLVILAFVVTTLVGLIKEYQSILYYLWGARNNFRFYVLLLACMMHLSSDGANTVFRAMDKLFYVNLAVTLYQFFFMGVKQDYLGGIFGINKGCNGYTNIYLLIVVVWHVLHYMNERESFGACVSIVLFSLVIAALAELKFFFLEFALVVVFATLITKFSARKLWIVVIGTLSLMIAMEVLFRVFPNLSSWFKLERIWDSITARSGYTNSDDINRLTFYPIILDRFLGSWSQVLFGLGLGNCDYAKGFDFLTTPFYTINRNLHYDWFSSAFLLLETGVVGLGLYLWMFVQIYFGARQRQKKGLADPILCQMARIMAVMCPILVIYNSSLRTEAGYMVYFVLALPFLKKDGRKRSAAFDKGKEVANVEKG